jgi:hypothetical protein
MAKTRHPFGKTSVNRLLVSFARKVGVYQYQVGISVYAYASDALEKLGYKKDVGTTFKSHVFANSEAIKEYLGQSKSSPISKQKTWKETSKDFFKSRSWLELRYKVLKKYGAKCMCCGATRADGVQIHVDHIKPRIKFPVLELEESNLQVLCSNCNIGKSYKDDTDWRTDVDEHKQTT